MSRFSLKPAVVTRRDFSTCVVVLPFVVNAM
jgi:hypothetical protein